MDTLVMVFAVYLLVLVMVNVLRVADYLAEVLMNKLGK